MSINDNLNDSKMPTKTVSGTKLHHIHATLIECSLCGGKIASNATWCPHCGLQIKKQMHPVWSVALGILVATVFPLLLWFIVILIGVVNYLN